MVNSAVLIRLLAGLLFFALFALAYFRLTRGRGKLIFGLASLVLILLFAFSPWVQALAFLPLIFLLTFSLVRKPKARQPYQPAQALVESGGVKRGLTAPEAAILLGRPLNQIMAVLLLGLQKKRVLSPVADAPVTFAVQEPFRLAETPSDLHARKAHRLQAAGEKGIVLYPYEEPFIEQLEASKGVPLEQVNFTAAMRVLLRQVAQRVRGHDLAATRAYYRQHLGRAKHDLEVATGEEMARKAIDRHFEWLLLDEIGDELLRGQAVDWAVGPESGKPSDFRAWVARLEAALITSIPPSGLQVRAADGTRLALGGRDPVDPDFFEAVLSDASHK